MAVICGTPAPVTTRVVQIEPGPMPTLMASAPARASSKGQRAAGQREHQGGTGFGSWRAARAGSANARQFVDALEQSLKKPSLLRSLGVTRNGQRNGSGEDVVRPKTRIHLEQPNEAANQQTGRDQEYE